MQDPSSSAGTQQFFTEQIVGLPIRITLGRRLAKADQPKRGVLVSGVSGRVEVMQMAALSLLADDPAQALAGRPVNGPALLRARRGWLIGGLLLWSVLLWGAFHVLEHGFP
ncbi:hypothetical protein [Ideonella margarita]|uniref:Uncharacterized protein n=1 Tax=Ideonella margarita TaxID=2984191 RepID=A0ABU9BZV0_9BURK